MLVEQLQHIYAPVTSDEESSYNLGSLRDLSFLIARLCGLDVFSTEIALTPDGRFVIVDYVNDPIDLRYDQKRLMASLMISSRILLNVSPGSS